MKTLEGRMEWALQGMERNLGGALPWAFKYYMGQAGDILNNTKELQDYSVYRLRYDTIIKQAKEKRII